MQVRAISVRLSESTRSRRVDDHFDAGDRRPEPAMPERSRFDTASLPRSVSGDEWDALGKAGCGFKRRSPSFADQRLVRIRKNVASASPGTCSLRDLQHDRHGKRETRGSL